MMEELIKKLQSLLTEIKQNNLLKYKLSKSNCLSELITNLKANGYNFSKEELMTIVELPNYKNLKSDILDKISVDFKYTCVGIIIQEIFPKLKNKD